MRSVAKVLALSAHQNRLPIENCTALRSRWLLYVPPQVGTHAMSAVNPLRQFARNDTIASLRPSRIAVSPDHPETS